MNNCTFNRQEAMILTNTTSSRLAYLDRIGVIVPEKHGSHKKPTVMYSWRQLLHIEATTYIQEFIPLTALKRVVHLLNTIEFEDELANKCLIVADTEMYTCSPDFSDLPDVIETISKQSCVISRPITIVSPLTDLAKHVCQRAIKLTNVDLELFKSRLGICYTIIEL